MTTRMKVSNPSRFYIRNEGPRVVETDYWGSSIERAGAVFCSIGSGAVRLLIPESLTASVHEMRNAREVLVTRAPWPGAGVTEALELMWEDDSPSPFAIQLSRPQFDRVIAAEEAGRHLATHVYVRGADGAPPLAGTWPSRFRVAEQLPCLESWSA